MDINRFFIAIFLLLSIGFVGSSIVQAEIVQGKDYTVLANKQSTQNESGIEVIEFFWYGCPHCNNLHPHIKAWLENIPEDVDFRYVPAIFRSNWIPGAKMFYAMNAVDGAEILHDRIYDAIHRDKLNLNDESVLFGWVEKQGVDREQFVGAYNSFSIQNQVARSTQMTQQYKLSGVPALVIDGRYVTSGKRGGTPQDTILVLDKILEKVRQERETE
ncbi:MAG: thiol:disulfide interchange protein DsbA/DsbL [Betaproteobacteria bacterium]|nr:thiol:disulfide interchange protein DsbA/DsbL [Betaproteobacteria bacterium]